MGTQHKNRSFTWKQTCQFCNFCSTNCTRESAARDKRNSPQEPDFHLAVVSSFWLWFIGLGFSGDHVFQKTCQRQIYRWMAIKEKYYSICSNRCFFWNILIHVMEHIFLDFLLSFSESHSSTSSSCHLDVSLMNSTPDLSFEFQTQLFEKAKIHWKVWMCCQSLFCHYSHSATLLLRK